MKKLLVIAAVAALFLGGWYFVYSLNEGGRDVETAEEKSRDAAPDGWVRYGNDELGFNFLYPDDWTAPEIDESEDSLGIYFRNENHVVFVGAVSDDVCPQGDGPGLTNVQGYVIEDGEYFSRWCKDERIQRSGDATWAETSDFKVVKTNSDEAITWVEECAFFECDTRYANASINLPGNVFKGVGAYMSWDPQVQGGAKVWSEKEGDYVAGYTANPVSFNAALKEFREVISTFEVSK